MPNFIENLIRILKNLFNRETETPPPPPTAPSPVPTPPPEPVPTPETSPAPEATATPTPPAAMSFPPPAGEGDDADLVFNPGEPLPQEEPKQIRVRNKIGFHTGPGGNPTGIGDWMQALDSAGIRFMIKSVDSYGPVYEASGLAKKSGVEHVLVYRVSTAGQGHEYDYDVPPYKDPKYVNDPEGGADLHWRKTLKKIPPEFDKQRTWIEPINEVDKNLCDWLGRFAVHLANLAHQDGYKVSLFAWSSGEPEPEGWETPGMLAYLRLCAERPNQAAVALHEYSYTRDNILDGYPYKIGRFKALFDVCDKYGITRPTVHITEWGWTLDNVPGPGQAIADIRKVMGIYAPYPEIAGAAIWYLGPGFAGIANKAQKLIKPVTDFTLNTIFEAKTDPPRLEPRPFPVPTPVPVDPPTPVEPVDPVPTPEPPAPVTPTPPPAPQPNVSFLADVTIPDDSRLPVGTAFVKTWRVRNSGNVAWTTDYKLVHTKGDAMTDQPVQSVPAAEPAQEVDISVNFSVPDKPGVYFSDWQLRDDRGNLFGDVVFTRIIAERTAVPLHSDAVYVADVTIPDDTVMPAGDAFVKTWRVKNIGTTTWGPEFRLEFEKGTAMTAQTSQPLPPVQPGKMAELSISLQAPAEKGTYFGDWRLKDAQGKAFGEIIFLRIVVDV